MSGGRGSSQSSTRIEQLAPELERIVSPSEPIRHLADGFGGAVADFRGVLFFIGVKSRQFVVELMTLTQLPGAQTVRFAPRHVAVHAPFWQT